MASNKNKKVTLSNTFEIVKEKAGVLNNEVIATSDAFVEGSVESIKQWQDVLGKALNNGTELLEQQQNIALDALESVVNQTKNGGTRFKSLLNFDLNFKSFWNKNKPDISLKNVKKVASETIENAKDKIEDVLEVSTKETEKAAKKVKKTTAKAKKVVNKANTKAKKTANKVTADVKKAINKK